jgi:deoxycytidylate deaminase
MYGDIKIKTHAEMDALNKIKKQLRRKRNVKSNKMNLIVIRTNKSGNLCNSAPCHHCTECLLNNKDIKIDKLYYSNEYGNIECIKFNEWINSGKKHVSEGWSLLQQKNHCCECDN